MRSGRCRDCGQTITWGVTYPGGKAMPMEPGRPAADDPRANLAVWRDHTDRITVRVVPAGEPIEGYEYRAIAHFTVCAKRAADQAAQRGELVDQNVIPLRRKGR